MGNIYLGCGHQYLALAICNPSPCAGGQLSHTGLTFSFALGLPNVAQVMVESRN